jgi:putative endopeptidase
VRFNIRLCRLSRRAALLAHSREKPTHDPHSPLCRPNPVAGRCRLRTRWGPGEALTELTAERTAQLIREASVGASAGSEARKIGDYYASFMDEAAIERLGLKPLQPGLQRIAAIKDRAGLARALGDTLRADVDVLDAPNLYTGNLFGLWVEYRADTVRNPDAWYGAFGVKSGQKLYLAPGDRVRVW